MLTIQNNTCNLRPDRLPSVYLLSNSDAVDVIQVTPIADGCRCNRFTVSSLPAVTRRLAMAGC